MDRLRAAAGRARESLTNLIRRHGRMSCVAIAALLLGSGCGTNIKTSEGPKDPTKREDKVAKLSDAQIENQPCLILTKQELASVFEGEVKQHSSAPPEPLVRPPIKGLKNVCSADIDATGGNTGHPATVSFGAAGGWEAGDFDKYADENSAAAASMPGGSGGSPGAIKGLGDRTFVLDYGNLVLAYTRKGGRVLYMEVLMPWPDAPQRAGLGIQLVKKLGARALERI